MGKIKTLRSLSALEALLRQPLYYLMRLLINVYLMLDDPEGEIGNCLTDGCHRRAAGGSGARSRASSSPHKHSTAKVDSKDS